MAHSPTTFQKGHPPYGKDLWSATEIDLLTANYATSSVGEIETLLPQRHIRSIHAKACKLGLRKDPLVRNRNMGQGIHANYIQHPELKIGRRQNGLRLARSPYHHRRKPGEFTLTPESRKKVSNTLTKTYKENPEIRRVACDALAKGRRVCQLKRPTEPEKQFQMLLVSLDIVAQPQYRLRRFLIDFALPEQKLAILIDGCYWHCCPIHYPMARTQAQQNNLLHDAVRDREIKKAGWRVLHIWEHDVNTPAALESLKGGVIKP